MAMAFSRVPLILAAEAASGHDMPLGSARNLLDQDEQECGGGLYLLRHQEEGTLLLYVQSGERAGPDYQVRYPSGYTLAEGTWEQVLPVLEPCSVDMPGD